MAEYLLGSLHTPGMNHPLKMIEIWTPYTELFVLEVMGRKRNGFFASCVRGYVWFLSMVYGGAIAVRRVLRRGGIR